MAADIPADLNTAVNRLVLAHLEGKSAHSDIAQMLANALTPLGDVQLFCPNWHAFRYVVASTTGVIFGFSVGMNTVAFRLDEKMKGLALRTGGIEYPECGDQWVQVVHHEQDSDWPAVDVRFWARKAYVSARADTTSRRTE